jgi:hypothetical protein
MQAQPTTAERAFPDWPLEATKVDHTLQPTHQVSFPNSEFIFSTDFSPDGNTVYCLIDGQSVDLWAAGLHRWPEMLGGVLALIIVSYLIVLARVRKRPQVLGTPYCRRCNYDVSSQPADAKCPECGVSLTVARPRLGRSFARRLRWPTAIAAALLCGYGLMLAACPRSPGVAGPDIWSLTIDSLVESYQPAWLLPHRVKVSRIVAVDTNTGTYLRCVKTFRNFSHAGLKVSPDGKFLVAADQNHNLLWLRSSSGRVERTTNAGEFRSGFQNEFLVGFDGPPSDPWVYFATSDQSAVKSRLNRWNPRTGQVVIVLDEPAFTMTYANGSAGALARRYRLLRRTDGLATLSAPDFLQAHREGKYAITLRAPESAGSAVEAVIPVEAPFVGTSPLMVSSESSRAFLTSGTTGLVRIDLDNHTTLSPVRPSVGEHVQHQASISDDGRRLFVAVFRNAVLVYSVPDQSWVARLQIPAPFIAPDSTASPCGRWLAATPFKTTASPRGPYKHELFLYDLTPLSAAK